MTDIQADNNKKDEVSNQDITPESEDIKSTKTKGLSKKKKIILIAALAVIECALVICFVVFFVMPYQRYSLAVESMNMGEYTSAIYTFERLGDFMDSSTLVTQCRYHQAVSFMKSGNYAKATELFEQLGKYEDSAERIKECKYLEAVSLMHNGSYDEAVVMFTELNDYEDSKSNIMECNYQKACVLMDEGSYEDAQTVFETMTEYKESKGNIKNCEYKIALQLIDDGKIVQAYEKLTANKGHEDSKKKAKSIKGTYNRIKAKSKIFVNKNWYQESDRSSFTATVIDDNTMKFVLYGWLGLADHTTETYIATWDSSTGQLNFTDGTCYLDHGGAVSCVYTGATGYLYYENGYLYLVNNKTGYTTTLW